MKLFILLLTVLFSITLFSTEHVGKIIGLSGRVFVKKSDSGFKKLKLNDYLYNGDVLKTSHNSRAKVIFVDDSIVSVAPKSQLKIEKYEFNKEKRERDSVLNLLGGKVKLLVAKLTKKRNFKVKTATATVGVRGTEFIVSTQNINESEVLVLSGSVEVMNPLDETMQKVILNKNDLIKTIGSLPVINPTKVTPQDLKRLNSGLNVATSINIKPDFYKLFKKIRLRNMLKTHKLRLNRIMKLKNRKKRLNRKAKKIGDFFKKGYLPPRKIKIKIKGELRGKK